MKTNKKLIALLLMLSMIIILIIPKSFNASEVMVNLRSTASFAILAGQTVTNTGSTVINGDAGGNVGVYPGSAFTGQTFATIAGAVHLNDAVAELAKQDLVLVYNDAAGRIPTTTFTETDNQLGGKTLTTGVYAFGHATTANLTASSPLILDAQGDPEAVFIFQSSSDLVTASGSQIQLINGAQFCRIFWQVTSSATLGTNSDFVGHIIALTSISVQTGATIQGQLLARNGSVTLDSNTITNSLCATVGETETGTTTNNSTATETSTTASTMASTVASTMASTAASTTTSTTASTTASTMASTMASTVASTTASTMASTVASTTASTMASTAASTTASTMASTVASTTALATASATTSTTASILAVKVQNSPKTGDYSADYFNIGMIVVASGAILAIIGMKLYFRRKKSVN